MKKCLILSAVPVRDSESLREHISECTFVIAADGGYNNTKALGIEPDVIIGDFDSLEYGEYGTETVRLPADKDDTDTVAAIRLAKERGFGEVVIAGGIGGERFDHAYANVVALFYARELGVKATLIDENNVVSAIENEKCIVSGDGYRYLSVFPFGGAAYGVTLKGVKYPLENCDMSCTFPLGVSNEIVEAHAEISVSEGKLILMRSEMK